MTEVLADVRSLLGIAGYQTSTPFGLASPLYFEDASVLGAVYLLPSTNELFSTWRQLQDSFLTATASRLSVHPLKAWNCYVIFLTHQLPGTGANSQLGLIEEDFRGARKIARAGLRTREDVEAALAPLLPLRRLLKLAGDDVKSRLASRLHDHSPPLRELLTEAPVQAIASSLLEAE